MTAIDRLQVLLGQNMIAGLDFIEVDPSQIVLHVHFYDNIPDLEAHLGIIAPSQVRIFSDNPKADPSEVPVQTSHWTSLNGKKVLELNLQSPGGFYLYRVRIDHTDVDTYFNNTAFSFKVNCPTDLDCKTKEHECFPDSPFYDFPVNYLARDFASYREALLDFASQRYPNWQDRLEADAGVMLVELMSALGDELSYYQDRIAREAYLETATQGRSLRQLARLVDYEVTHGLGASGWLDLTIGSGNHTVDAGSTVWALSEQGEKIYYEVGRGAVDYFFPPPPNVTHPLQYDVSSDLNSLTPYIWDEDDLCLPAGATSMYVKQHWAGILSLNDPPENPTGRWVLLQTEPTSLADASHRWMVRLVQIEDTNDDLTGEPLTQLTWEKAQALPFSPNLEELKVRCNLVPITAGITHIQRFVIGVDPKTLSIPDNEKVGLLRAIEREGANDTVLYRMTLEDPTLQTLVWLGSTPSDATPELLLEKVEYSSGWVAQTPPWEWRRSLLGINSSLPNDQHYTLEQGSWGRVASYWEDGQEKVYEDYKANNGVSIRFGDNEFGLIPSSGTIFQATYRLGNGTKANVAADTILHFDTTAWNFVSAVKNPLAIDDAVESESFDVARMLAPEAFRYETFRAVRKEDYTQAAERLDWVQQAGTAARWTGSWLTLFSTADAKDAASLSQEQQQELFEQLDRYRQAGRDVVALVPKYADLDLKLTICVEQNAYSFDVRNQILIALFGDKTKGLEGFFSPNNFQFATPLYRSALESAVQGVSGVHSVSVTDIRRRGWFGWKPFAEWVYPVGKQEIVRVVNDPDNPAMGSVELTMVGGL